MKTVNVVGIGGSLRPQSKSFEALQIACELAEQAGADVSIYSVATLQLPPYCPSIQRDDLPPTAKTFFRDIEKADIVIISSPAYHGTISGSLKNVLDYFEFFATCEKPYLSGKVVSAITVGSGIIAPVQACSAILQISQALRAFTNPFVCPITEADKTFTSDVSGVASQVIARITAMMSQSFHMTEKLGN